MASTKTRLYYGALLHDVGKVVRRATHTERSSCELGADFIQKEVADLNESFAGEDGRAIVEQMINPKDKESVSTAGVPDDSLAYITWFADSVASGGRIEGVGQTNDGSNVDGDIGLRKIYNVLNGHHDDGVVEHEDYGDIAVALRDGISSININSAEIDSLLYLLESTVSTVPVCNDTKGLADVSLFDHAKTTACVAACVYEYLREHEVQNYREALFGGKGTTLAESMNMFLLYSCDMSGIQDFIYNISGDGALKQLRARSMYLELLLEHVVDELLERLKLNRSNLLYTGGGHAYLLLPNTQTTIAVLREFMSELKAWFVAQYRNDLYIASAWVECNADDLANRGEDKTRYSKLYRHLSHGLSESKVARYDAETIRMLNFGTHSSFDYTRECGECHRSDISINKVHETEKCTLCASLGEISKHLVDKDVFVIERSDGKNHAKDRYAALDLPFGCVLRMFSYERYRTQRPQALRVYTKGEWNVTDGSAIRIWMGDYTADVHGEGISAYASQGITLKQGLGIKRLGVLRADVDDLGAAFAGGLPDEKTFISRTSVLSRSLSLFFKHEINEVLREGNYQVQIIYSGGDDLFIIGNWSDVIYAAMDIRNAFDKYTGNGSLTLSAGIGIFDSKYPIARMASEVGELENKAKEHATEDAGAAKNAIALWSPEYVFGWDEFTAVVLPRMYEIGHMFSHNQKGTAFIYRLIALLRNYDAMASAPRLAYLLARSFEGDREHDSDASSKLYTWAQNPKERRRLIVALEWYVCSIRERSE